MLLSILLHFEKRGNSGRQLFDRAGVWLGEGQDDKRSDSGICRPVFSFGNEVSWLSKPTPRPVTIKTIFTLYSM